MSDFDLDVMHIVEVLLFKYKAKRIRNLREVRMKQKPPLLLEKNSASSNSLCKITMSVSQTYK